MKSPFKDAIFYIRHYATNMAKLSKERDNSMMFAKVNIFANVVIHVLTMLMFGQVKSLAQHNIEQQLISGR